jgi:hypothetical protein
MDKDTLLGGITGAILMMIFALGPLIWSGFFEAAFFAQDNLFFNLVMMLLSPIAGGFIAGFIGRSNPRRAGLLAGLGGGMVLFSIWLVISGVSWQAMISGLVVIFVWIFLASIGAGFSTSR